MTMMNPACSITITVTLTKKRLRWNFLLVLVLLNLIAVKLELFGNIPLVLDFNDLKYCEKALYGVESFFMEYHPSLIKWVESSSAKCNPSIIQRVEPSSTERNASVPTKLPIIDDVNNIELHNEAMIKANRHLFKSVSAINEYIKTFDFGKDRLMV